MRLVVLASVLAAACGTARSYSMNTTGSSNETLSAIAECANARKLESRRGENAVQVRLDDVSYADYTNAGGALELHVVVDDAKVPKPEMEAKFNASKAVADEIFACAQGKTGQASPAPAAAPAATAAPAGSITYAGNWMAKIDYSWSCKTSMTRPEAGKDSGTWAIAFSGAPNALNGHVKASHDGYDLTGSAANGTLRVCGPFPLKGKSSAAGTIDTNLCLIADHVEGPSRATGHVEGSYVTELGLACKVTGSTLELTQ